MNLFVKNAARGLKMSTRRRRHYVRRVASELFETVLIDAVCDGKLIAYEAERIKFQLHIHLKLPNLYPSDTPLGPLPPDPTLKYDPLEYLNLKLDIIDRLGSYHPVNLPDRALPRIRRENIMRVIVAKKPGHTVDTGFFDAMMKTIQPTFVGTGRFDGEKLQGETLPNIDIKQLIPALKETEGELKDSAVIYFFDSDSSEGEDGQPYQLLADEDGTPVLACFVEGEFGNYKSPKELVTEYLIDEITPV